MIESIVAVSWHQKRVLTYMAMDWYFYWLLSTTLIFFFHWPSSIFSKKKNPVFFRRITNGFFIFIIRRTGRRQNIFTFQTDLKINRATTSPWIDIMTGEFCNDFVILWSKYWNKLLFQQKLSRILIFWKISSLIWSVYDPAKTCHAKCSTIFLENV